MQSTFNGKSEKTTSVKFGMVLLGMGGCGWNSYCKIQATSFPGPGKGPGNEVKIQEETLVCDSGRIPSKPRHSNHEHLKFLFCAFLMTKKEGSLFQKESQTLLHCMRKY